MSNAEHMLDSTSRAGATGEVTVRKGVADAAVWGMSARLPNVVDRALIPLAVEPLHVVFASTAVPAGVRSGTPRGARRRRVRNCQRGGEMT